MRCIGQIGLRAFQLSRVASNKRHMRRLSERETKQQRETTCGRRVEHKAYVVCSVFVACRILARTRLMIDSMQGRCREGGNYVAKFCNKYFGVIIWLETCNAKHLDGPYEFRQKYYAIWILLVYWFFVCRLRGNMILDNLLLLPVYSTCMAWS